jgi:phosphinothricin acetyltransferase
MQALLSDESSGTLIRSGRSQDLGELTRIYNHYVVATPITFDVEPFSVDRRRAWFADHPDAGQHRLLVAERDGEVLGYATSSAFRAKPAYSTSVETSVYLAPEHGGQGIGSMLYTALFDVLRCEDVHRAYAGVTLPNEASVRLHERFGFRRLGVYHEVGRKFGRYWDVAWFEKSLNE